MIRPSKYPYYLLPCFETTLPVLISCLYSDSEYYKSIKVKHKCFRCRTCAVAELFVRLPSIGFSYLSFSPTSTNGHYWIFLTISQPPKKRLMFGLFYPIFLNRGNSFCRLCFLSDAVFGIHSYHIILFYWMENSKIRIYQLFCT